MLYFRANQKYLNHNNNCIHVCFKINIKTFKEYFKLIITKIYIEVVFIINVLRHFKFY